MSYLSAQLRKPRRTDPFRSLEVRRRHLRGRRYSQRKSAIALASTNATGAGLKGRAGLRLRITDLRCNTCYPPNHCEHTSDARTHPAQPGVTGLQRSSSVLRRPTLAG